MLNNSYAAMRYEQSCVLFAFLQKNFHLKLVNKSKGLFLSKLSAHVIEKVTRVVFSHAIGVCWDIH